MIETEPLRVGRRLHRGDRLVHARRRRCTAQHIEPQLAADDPRHVEQIVDQPRLHARAARDGLDRCSGRCSSNLPVSRICAQPLIAVSGVRSSCETVITNSSFNRAAVSVSRCARCSISSAGASRSLTAFRLIRLPPPARATVSCSAAPCASIWRNSTSSVAGHGQAKQRRRNQSTEPIACRRQSASTSRRSSDTATISGGVLRDAEGGSPSPAHPG